MHIDGKCQFVRGSSVEGANDKEKKRNSKESETINLTFKSVITRSMTAEAFL